jgi:hypothetical protein
MNDHLPGVARSGIKVGPSSSHEAAVIGPARMDPSSELEAIYREGEDLRRSGTSEDAVIARLEEQLQNLTARLDKETAEKLAEIRATPASARGFVVPMRYRLPVLIAVVAVVAGSVLELTIGQQFVFSAANQYRAMVPWLLVFLAPAFAWAWFVLERANRDMAGRYPTWWVRWLFVYPLVVALSSAMVAISPLGWFAVYGRLWGTPTEGVKAKMLAIGDYRSSSRGCHQDADIFIDGSSARICLASVLAGRTPAVGETVNVAGHISSAGVFIDEVRAK